MGAARNIVFKFIGDAKSLQKAAKGATNSLGKVSKKVSGTTTKMDMLRGSIGKLGLAMGAGALFQGFKSAIRRAEEMDSKYAITRQIIEDTGGAAGLTAVQVKEMAKQMAMTTGLDKSVVTDAANVLLTFKEIKQVAGDNNGLFEQALKITGDMATVFGGTAKDAAKQLGKALNDPIGGIAALSRVGVQFTEDQKKVIRSFVEMGDVASAQTVILGELESQVGGAAAASADATAIMGNAFLEVQEIIGNELLPEIKELAPAVVSMAQDIAPAVKLVVGELGDLLGAVTGVAAGIDTMNDSSLSTAEQMGGLEKANLSVARALEFLGPNLLSVADAMDEQKRKADAAETAALGLSFQMSDLADETVTYKNVAYDAADAVANLADEQRKLVDPVFKARKAQEKFQETLVKVKEDGVITAAELDTLTGTYLDLQAANDAVTPDNMEAYRDAITDVRENVVNDVDLMDEALRGVGSQDTLQPILGVIEQLESIQGRPITIDLTGLRMATRSEMEQAVTRVLYQMQRGGRAKNVFL